MSSTASQTVTAAAAASTGELAVALLVALVGGTFLGSVVQGLYQRRKLGADYAEVVARSATSLLTPLATRVEELQDELAGERQRVRQLSHDLDAAREDLSQARLAVRLLREELSEARRDVAEHRRETREL